MKVVSVEQRLFAFYLVPDFTMMAFSSAIDALRLANAVVGYEAYSWRAVSSDGAKVRASCGLTLEADNSVAVERQHLNGRLRPSVAVICGGKHIERHADRGADAWLRECRNRGVAVAALCTGAHVLAQAGLLDDRKCAIHWENQPGFIERFPAVNVSTGIYEVDGNIYTCAGGAASFDMMLHIIGRDFGEDVVSGICELALVDRVRDPGERQRLPFAQRVGVQDPTVMKLVEKMEKSLTEPMQVEELTASIGLSRRQVERLFRNELRCSPARYYLKLRLERARLLLVQTSIPVVEVAIACGFVSASHFSKCYREAFGCSPQETRGRAVKTPAARAVACASAA
ncbi:GlxA family transcriptional regulator [Sinorhizobium saheli]|jgi:transcriptional regulator GlxA family with amidase domain|uniref:AraC family transcriptional regulator n=1 Tax=Sinorhizobium saheli TaxID=36856 RepID=A0A178YRU2_SINSA|nr:GlxA family transcriptional regulator [Sinorhizobium saheli]MQW88539.1 helix-turn-helix domain-containing protein [Sinorhizobium saheli]OAP50107.1 AraC family transcriptional regulator [Sinorhizobium saheli]